MKLLGFSRFSRRSPLARVLKKTNFIPEWDYREGLATGEIVAKRADSQVIRGDELLAQVQARTGRQGLIAFSGGKDSLACYLAIRPRFDRLVPVYMYGVPDLEFVEEGLRYFELNLTDEPIVRMPHPQLYRMLGNCIFQPPNRVAVLDAAAMDDVGYDNELLRQLVIEEVGLPPQAMVATGVRAADSPLRRLGIVRHGPINWKNSTYMPIWDWRKAAVMQTIRDAKIRLPVDYDLFGRSFDGVQAHYLWPIKQYFPRDYAKILEWFPLADMELWRMQRYGGG